MGMAQGEAFWRFSLAFYARPGAAEALLALQDRAGANVNLLLYGLWAGAVAGVRLDAADVAAATAAITPLDGAVVAPLRALRRRLKPDPDRTVQALRRRIAAFELAAERVVQQRLAAGLPRRAAADDRLAVASANLALLLAGADPVEAGSLRRALGEFLAR